MKKLVIRKAVCKLIKSTEYATVISAISLCSYANLDTALPCPFIIYVSHPPQVQWPETKMKRAPKAYGHDDALVIGKTLPSFIQAPPSFPPSLVEVMNNALQFFHAPQLLEMARAAVGTLLNASFRLI